MKYIIYFLLFSSAVFSQNYQYAIEELNKKPLGEPTGLIASQITETSVVLTWTAPADATSVTDYGIYSNNVLLATSAGTGTTYKLTGLTPETSYTLTVRSIDKAGKSSVDSNVQTFTTSKVVVVAVLNPPKSLIASDIKESSVVLTWTAPIINDQVADYGIYSKNIMIAKALGTGTTYRVTGLTSETAYSVTVRSLDKSGKMSVDSNIQTFTTTKIGAPTNLIASQITETSIVLTWTAPTDISALSDYGIYSNNILIAKSVGTGTSFKVTGLTPETAYSLTVRSIDKAGKTSVDSNVQAVTTKKVYVEPILGSPTNLIASQITETSVVLTWTAPADATSVTDYGIYSNNVLLATSVGTGTTYKLTGLTPETSYTLTVRSIDKAGKSSVDSNSKTITTNKVVVIVPILGAPTGLIASQITETSVVLTWTAPADATSVTDYGIYSNNVLLATSAGTGTTYKLTGLTPETSYTLTVRSIDKAGKSSVDSNSKTITTNKVVVIVPILGAPTGLIASQITETSVVLTWTAPADATSVTDYGIYSNNVLIATSAGTGTTYKLTGLTPETAYTLTVRSIDKAGKSSVDSNSKTITTNKVVVIVPILEEPTGLIASQITANSAVLTWTAPADATSVTDYGIYSNNVLLATSAGPGTSYKLTGLTSETAYNLTVRSIDKAGKSSVDSKAHLFTTVKLEAPTNLKVSDITETSAVLTWTAPADATSVTDYGIYSNNVLVVKSQGIGTTYTVTGLIANTAYAMTVRAMDKAGKMSVDSNQISFTTNAEDIKNGVKNQLEEIEYFKAYLLPIAQKGTLQAAIDKYGSVRLEKGDYSGVNVVMKSNQRLYGHPSSSGVATITVAAGSTNVHLESLRPLKDSALYISFQPGAVISNCTFKTMKYAVITAQSGTKLENNIFVDLQQSQVTFDASASGYFRNNTIIKHMKQGGGDVLNIRGNSATPSYGNVSVHTNYLGSAGKATDFDTLESMTLIGQDAETYGGLSREIIHVNNVDKLKLFITNGTLNYDKNIGFSSIDATEVLSVDYNGISETKSKISSRTNLLSLNSEKLITREAGTVNGYTAQSYLSQVGRDYFPHFSYEGKDITSTIQDPTVVSKLTNSILGSQHTPWNRPNLEIIPDPLGANWKTERVGKPDSTSYIQNLINTNGVADLPEGVFYISSTLKIPIGVGKGITGQGTGKTVICGLKDDFPLISVNSGDFGSIDLAYITLQGGSVGLYVNGHTLMMSFQSLKFVSFREQQSGMEIYDIFGLDNCFFEHLSFINCDKGIYQHPFIGALDPNNIAGSTYLDKNVFYKCQFLNCTTSMDLRSSRASNLNAWVDCKFDGGVQAADMQADTSIFANCDFTNFTGSFAIKSNSLNLISCNFYNNSNAKSTLYSIVNNIEGCNFLDNTPLASPIDGNPVRNFIANSTITGNAVVIPDAIAWRPTFSTYVNSRLLSNPTFNKLFVEGVSNVPTVILDAAPNPYPQFLVKQ